MPRFEPQEPAKEFEKEHDLTGIATSYVFPSDSSWTWRAMAERIANYTGIVDPQKLMRQRVKEFGHSVDNPSITPSHIKHSQSLTDAFSRFVGQRDSEELTVMLAKLEVLNPQQIATIRFDRTNRQQLVDVLHGIISGFHPDDINFYLQRGMHGERSANEDHRRELESRVLARLGNPGRITLGWVASTPTLERIWEQVKERPHRPRDSRTTKTVSPLAR